ncbi:MAG: hypothetical protein FJX67_00650 [Alphaproteobacteria bacterium]|nr:hypothetical protein [Alphaproteobacteria bacterium]
MPSRDEEPVPLASYRGIAHRLTAICETCLHSARLDREALIACLGPNATTAELRRRLRCSRCGGRDIALQVNGSPCGAMARHGP